MHNEPIAIVGIGCRFPGAVRSATDFWNLLEASKDAITEVPSLRWKARDYFDVDPGAPNKMISKWGGFIDDIEMFDPQFFGISGREAESIDPQQRIFVEVAWEALEDANIPPRSLLNSKTSVFAGVFSHDYENIMFRRSLCINNPHTGTGANEAAIAGRLSYTLGLKGPSMTVNTACSGSLVAVHLARQSLLSKESDIALAGGVNLILSPEYSVVFSKAKMLAPDGRCKTFDESANGYVRSEGCGILVLKRLSDAVENGDRIYAVVASTAVNQDGSSGGLTVPNGPAQEELMREALRVAQLSPGDVQYIEAHGTGTSLGDPLEVNAIGNVLSQGRTATNPLYIGSVKTNIGHTEAAAGIAGIVKVALALQRKRIPPNLHFKKVNPSINLDKIPAVVPTTAREWTAEKGKRVGAVSSFGFSGTNAHAILTEYVSDVSTSKKDVSREGELVCLSARSREALRSNAKNLGKYVRANEDLSLSSIAYSLACGRSHFEERVAFVARSRTELLKLLDCLESGGDDPVLSHGSIKSEKPKLAFLFSGQGSQYPKMGYALYKSDKVFREAFDDCANILQKYLSTSLQKLVFEGDSSLINDTKLAQPALFALEYALYKMWDSVGIRPSMLLGHSVGEYVAAHIAGIFNLEDGLKLISARSSLMSQLPRDGAMAAIVASEAELQELININSTKIAVAAVNGPESVVVSGQKDEVEKIASFFAGKGRKTKLLNVSHAFHSPLLEPMLSEFLTVARTIKFDKPKIPIISNLTGKRADARISTPEYWVEHARNAVQFSKGIQTIWESGIRRFLEVGPGSALAGLGQMAVAHLPANEAMWEFSIKKDEHDEIQILRSAGSLYAAGFDFNWLPWYSNLGSKVSLPTYSFQRKRFWVSKTEDRSSQQQMMSNHPWLSRKIQSVSMANGVKVFDGTIGIGANPFLTDHRIYGHAVVPGAAFVEMAIASARELIGDSFEIAEMSVERSLGLADDESRRIQIALEPAGKGKFEFRIATLTEGSEDGWLVHATGKILHSATSSDAKLVKMSEVIKADSFKHLKAKDRYTTYRGRGLEYGPMFTNVQESWVGSGEAVGRIVLNPELSTEFKAFNFHPALLDACLQIVYSNFPNASEAKGTDTSAFMPVGFKKIKFYGPCEERLWCHTKFKKEADNSRTLTADQIIVGESGRIVAEIEGFALVEATREALQKILADQMNKSDWLYRVKWKELQLSNADGGIKDGSAWLLIGDRKGIAKDIGDFIEQKKGRAYFISEKGEPSTDDTFVFDSADSIGMTKAFENFAKKHPDVKISHIVHLGGLDCQYGEALTFDSTVLDKDFSTGVGSLLQVVAALQKVTALGIPKVSLVTRGAVDTSESQKSFSPTGAAVWGLGQVITIEHPEFKLSRIDLDPGGEVTGIQTLISEMLAEPESGVAFRGGKRLVCRLEKTSIDQAKSPSLKSDATYLVTGGLGGLGLRLAEYLSSKGAKNVVLAGRRSPDDTAKAVIDKLSQSGVLVKTVQCDTANESQVKEMLKTVSASAPLAGVFHAAGVSDWKFIFQETLDGLKSALGGKAKGAWYLHHHTKDLKLDHFVLFSSAATLLPAASQGAYSASNAVLDQIAAYRKRIGLSANSINWGVWQDTGMSKSSDGSDRQWDKGGMGAIPVEKGMEILGSIVAAQATRVAVIPINWNNYFNSLPDGVNLSMFEGFVPASRDDKAGRGSTGGSGDIVAKLKSASNEDRGSLLSEFVVSAVVAVLKLSEQSELDPKASLMSIGMDSLLAVELRNRLKKSLGDDLGSGIPATLVFAYPTIDAICGFLAKEVLPKAIPDFSASVGASGGDELDQQLEEMGAYLSEDELAALLAGNGTKN